MAYRWLQLFAGIVAMVAVANFQYAWTLFVGPMRARHGWSAVAVQDALNLFFLPAQTWLVPLEGYLSERFGPRRLLAAGGLLTGLAWVVNAQAASLPVLYAAQVLSGCGSGIVYSISVGSALKWFPDRRGLAAGLTAAAFGAGSAATVEPIRGVIAAWGYEAAFLGFGLGQAALIVAAGLVIRFPLPEEVIPLSPGAPGETGSGVPARLKNRPTPRDYRPFETLRSPVFWLLYVMMMIGAVPGLLMVGQLAPFAEDFGIAAVPVTLLGITRDALPFALILDRLCGGLTRPIFGWISDRVGRERAIFAAFALEGTALWILIRYAAVPQVFVVMSGLAFFGWGAIFSLFPAVSGDSFGRAFATTNYACLYTAKGASSLLVALLARLQAEAGWQPVFACMIVFDWLAAFLALGLLQPLRRRAAAVAIE